MFNDMNTTERIVACSTERIVAMFNDMNTTERIVAMFNDYVLSQCSMIYY